MADHTSNGNDVEGQQAGDTTQPETIRVRTRRRRSPFSNVALVVLAVLGGILLWLALDLLLLLFAGILLAIFLRAVADVVSRWTSLGAGLSLATVLLVLLVTAAGFGTLFATQLVGQAQEISERLPQASQQLLDWLEQQEWSRWVVEQARGGSGGNGSALEQAEVMQHASTAASTALDALVAFVIVLFVGIYLAANPAPYIRGLLRLVPIRRRVRIGETLYAAGYTLRWWLFGQLLAMTVVGVTMTVGLAIIGVPLALGLGVIAGLFEFIPTLGPILGLLPALLLAVVDDPQKALWVLVLYAVIQSGEAYVLTPLVQQRVVHLPPVLTIAAQVFFAWRLGAAGLIVAVPVIAVVMVAVQMLYVKDVLGDRFELTAEEEGRRELDEAGHLKSAG